MTQWDDLQAQLSQLEARLDATSGLVAAFDSELAGLGRSLLFTSREADALSRSFGNSLRRAFDGVAFDGARLSDTMRQLGRSMSDAIYGAAMRPVQRALGGALAGALGGILPFARGGSFAQGRVMPFAGGGVVSAPVAFPMRSGTGLMGEAGPEAIMPLSRGTDGRLGVHAEGGRNRPVSVTFNITTPDIGGFQRSQNQIAAQMNRLLAQGQRNA